ncbi:MAG: hypothetical protein KatS3mg100_069 [Candidatus Parcubacteria bacterium]|nr:MAG: hypothetical protein KatS3mg100_069 [Candidatus Parcubacteria bacterium]
MPVTITSLMTLTKSISSKVAAIAIASALVVGSFFAFGLTQARALTEDQIQSILSLLRSFGADQTTVANVEASLRGQAPSGGSGSGVASSVCPYTWQRNLGPGDTGDDVKKLQQFLNERGFTVASSGAGSPGNESTYYGTRTGQAVKQFQEAYASEILAPLGLSQGTVYFWTHTRAKANELCQQAQSGGQQQGGNQGQGGQSQVPGTGLMVAPGTQPANGLFVEFAARVPFTVFTVTAGADGDVTLNSVVVRKAGSVNKAAFDGVVLLDQDGMQLGTAKTFNTNNEATIGTAVTIPAGQTRTFTVAANAPASATGLDSYAGQVGGISVVGLNTSATVSGSLPITGAMHTVNATLQIGTVTADVSSFDPGAPQTKEIGTTGYRFSGFRLTAGSAEDVRFKSVRFNQVGSATKEDLANVKVVVDGVEYPTVVTTDGKYYTATFGNGILIAKGNSVDVYIQGDIVGSNANGRTIDFDVEEKSDIVAMGETYGYGILPTAGAGSQFSNTATPFFNGYVVTVQGGQVTIIQKSNAVPAQNIAANVPDQPLGGFETNLTGEGLTVQKLYFGFDLSGAFNASHLTNVVLVDENGAVVAGPADGVASGIGTDGYVLFTDTVTFPTGQHTYTLKGKVASSVTDGTTITATTTVNSTYWVNPKGEITGDSYTLPGTTVTMNTMTVKGAKLTVSVSSNPTSQNIVAGAQNFTFANIIFDATGSGEDVRLSSMKMTLTESGVTADDKLVGCQLWDGSTALNYGSNTVNSPAAGTVTFTFNNPFTVPKGTSKTVALKCTVPTAADTGDTYQWDFTGLTDIGAVTGVISGVAVTQTVSPSTGATMTVANGSFTVAKADDSPSYKVVAGGATGVTIAKYKVRATNEDMDLRKITLQMTTYGSGTTTEAVFQNNRVKLYNGSTKVGEALFTGSTTVSTLDTPVRLPKDQDVTLSVVADFAPIGPSQPGIQGALVQVDYDGNNASSTEATGGASGATVSSSSTSDTAVDGVRVFRSFPTVAKLSVPSTSIVAGTMDLYRFSVSADAAGNVKLYKLTVNLATSTGTASQGTTTVTNLKVYAYTDSGFTTPVSGFTNGQVVSTITSPVNGDNDAVLSSVLTIPAGSTYYFRVVGDVTTQAGSSGYSGSITTKLSGDAAYPDVATNSATTTSKNMATATEVDGDTHDDFIWSPDKDGNTVAGTDDWTNGYQVPGLPSDGTDVTTLSK